MQLARERRHHAPLDERWDAAELLALSRFCCTAQAARLCSLVTTLSFLVWIGVGLGGLGLTLTLTPTLTLTLTREIGGEIEIEVEIEIGSSWWPSCPSWRTRRRPRGSRRGA